MELTPRKDDSDRDALWIRQIADGDRTAFESLYRAYQQRLFGYAFRMMGEAGAAEELTNDVMLEVWKGAARFRGDSRPSSWIFGIAHHLALNEFRRRRPEVADVEKAAGVADGAEGPEERMIRKGIETRLRSAMASLSVEHKEVVELTFYQGCSYEEIAGIVRCPVNTVKTRMFYAKKKLQDVLGKMGWGGER